MRISIAAALFCMSTAGLAAGPAAEAAVRRHTDIKPQPLDTALQVLAKERDLQMIYSYAVVGEQQTAGATGNLTFDEAIGSLLKDTGLSYSFLDESTVTIVSPTDGIRYGQPSTTARSGNDVSGGGGQKSFWSRLRLAQSDSPSPSRGEGQGADGKQAQSEKKNRTDAESEGTSVAPVGKNEEANIPEILVYGSRSLNMDIRRTENDIQSYQVLDSQVIEQAAPVDIEVFLRDNVSMNAVGLVASQWGGHVGNSETVINLRGLGPSQSLVLINGRRIGYRASGGRSRQPSINTLPTAAIERIEVLPSAASSIYGGAAAGGVVNIITKQKYDGGEFNIEYASPTDTHAPSRTLSMAYGFTPGAGKTSGFVAGHYSYLEPLYGRDRVELMRRGLDTILQNDTGILYSPTTPYMRGSTPNIRSADGSNLTLKPDYGGGSLNSPITSVPLGTSASTSAATLGAGLMANAGSYNLEPGPHNDRTSGLGSQLTPDGTTISVMATLRHQFTDRLEAFAEILYANNYYSSVANVASNNITVVIPSAVATNPFNQDIRIGFSDSADSALYDEYDSRRVAVGLLAKLGASWLAEFDYTRNTIKWGYGGRFPAPSSSDIASGTLNPLVDVGATGIPLLNDYLRPYGANYPSSLDDFGLRGGGPIGHLPAGDPTLTLGLGHRIESLKWGGFFNNALNSRLENFPQEQNVTSIYAELNAPVVSDVNARPGIRRLDLQLAGRSERYSVEASTRQRNVGDPTPPTHRNVDFDSTNFTAGFRYQPVNGLTLRASYGTAFLPPDFEQFLDPLRRDLFSGVPAQVFDPKRNNEIVFIGDLQGGNPAVQPTETKNWNVGLILEPSFAPGLRFNVEWFRFEQDNVIIIPTVQQIIDREDSYPGRVTRAAPAPGETLGQITLVDASILNAATTEIEGFDFAADYDHSIEGHGALSFMASATLFDTFEQQRVLGAPMDDLLNHVHRDGPLELRGNASVSWLKNAWSIGWRTNYFGSYHAFDGAGGIYLLAQGSNRIPSQLYHSVFAGYQFEGRDGFLSGVTISGGVRNVFNELPPFDAYTGQGDRYPWFSVFGDPRLRSAWLSLTKQF